MTRKKDILIKVAFVLFIIIGSIGAIFLGKVLSDSYIKNNPSSAVKDNVPITSIPLEIE